MQGAALVAHTPIVRLGRPVRTPQRAGADQRYPRPRLVELRPSDGVHREAPAAEQPRHASKKVSLAGPTLGAPAPGPSGLVVSVWATRGILGGELFCSSAL